MGLGRIGLATAVTFVRAGRAVVGVERDEALLDDIRDGALSYAEPEQLGPALDAVELRSSIDELDGSTIDAWIVCVGTNDGGRLDASGVVAVARKIIGRARSAAVVAIESTVPPGTCDELAELRADVHIVHCPERGAPGNLIAELATQPRLIGGTTPQAAQAARELYEDVGTGPLVVCTARESELAKLAENAHRAVNVAFAGELARTARALQVDPRRLVELANTHPRVEILRPGLGAGGDCLPMATRWFADRDERGVAAGARRIDAGVADEILALMRREAPAARRVALLGTAYKPDVAYAHAVERDRSTPAHALYAALATEYDVTTWDGLREQDDHDALQAALTTADVVVFGCAHRLFGELDPVTLRDFARGAVAIDFVGAIDASWWQAAGWSVLR